MSPSHGASGPRRKEDSRGKTHHGAKHLDRVALRMAKFLAPEIGDEAIREIKAIKRPRGRQGGRYGKF